MLSSLKHKIAHVPFFETKFGKVVFSFSPAVAVLPNQAQNKASLLSTTYSDCRQHSSEATRRPSLWQRWCRSPRSRRSGAPPCFQLPTRFRTGGSWARRIRSRLAWSRWTCSSSRGLCSCRGRLSRKARRRDGPLSPRVASRVRKLSGNAAVRLGF